MEQREFVELLVSLGSKKTEIRHDNSTVRWMRNYTEVRYSTPEIPEDREIYVRFIGGVAPRIGAIGRVTKFIPHEGTYYSHPGIRVEFDERPGKAVDANYHQLELMPDDHAGGTRWCWNTRNHDKKEIPVPVNRFNQELHEGTLVVANRYGKHGNLMFGYVSRYTVANVWIRPLKISRTCPKSAELRADSISETFVLPEDFEHTYLFAVKLMSD